MSGRKTLEETIEHLEDAIRRAREATSEANSSAKALRQAERAIRDLLRTEVRALVDEALVEQVRDGLEGYAETIRTAQEAAVAKVEREFGRLATIFLGEEEDAEESLEDIARRLRARRLQ